MPRSQSSPIDRRKPHLPRWLVSLSPVFLGLVATLSCISVLSPRLLAHAESLVLQSTISTPNFVRAEWLSTSRSVNLAFDTQLAALLSDQSLTASSAGLNPNASWHSDDNDYTSSIAWGDVDGDGDLDLAVGNSDDFEGAANKLYLNEGGTLQTEAVWVSNDSDFTSSIAWGDVDGDDDLDLAAGGSTTKVYLNEGCAAS